MNKERNLTIKVKSTNLGLTPALEKYVSKKISLLDKHLEYYYKRAGDLMFEIEIAKKTNRHKQGDIYYAEINFSAGDVHLRSEFTSEDIYVAIDGSKDTMEREMRRYSNKHRDLFRRGGAKIKRIIKGFPYPRW